MKHVAESYKNFTPDQRAGLIVYLWLTRGINLISDDLQQITPPLTASSFSPLSTVPLLDLKNGFEEEGVTLMANAVNHYYLTHVAISFPKDGYWKLVDTMWERLFEDLPDMADASNTILSPLYGNSDYEQLIEHNDIPVDDFINNPELLKNPFMKVVSGYVSTSR